MSQRLQAIRPRIGKGQVIHCLDAYQHERNLEELKRTESLSGTLAGFLRKTSMVPVVSDFLFDDVDPVIDELARLDVQHDVVEVLEHVVNGARRILDPPCDLAGGQTTQPIGLDYALGSIQ